MRMIRFYRKGAVVRLERKFLGGLEFYQVNQRADIVDLSLLCIGGSHAVNTLSDQEDQPDNDADAWSRPRGALKEVFAELGGGEAYLQAERGQFYGDEEGK